MNKVAAVTNRHLSRRPYLEQIQKICREKPAALIVREKDLAEDEYAVLARQVLEICRQYQVLCIYHSYPSAAREAGVTSVHLPLFLLRRYSGSGILESFTSIGTSVHDEQEAEEAVKLGATYLVAGHIYATDCKKSIPPRGTDFLRQICRQSPVPVWAIGGIHLDARQIKEVCSCGAAGVCMMSEIMKI